jgi:hypothetical protein
MKFSHKTQVFWFNNLFNIVIVQILSNFKSYDHLGNFLFLVMSAIFNSDHLTIHSWKVGLVLMMLVYFSSNLTGVSHSLVKQELLAFLENLSSSPDFVA